MAEIAVVEPNLGAESKELATIDVGVDIHEARERGRIDINFFASLAMPEVMVSPLPFFYVMVFGILTQRKPEEIGRILRFALGLPRAHAKTTFIKVIICWLIVYDKVSFPLFICASEPLAEQLLADVNDMLGSPNMEAVFGNWTSNLSTDTKELKKAMYHKRPVVLAAKGAQSSVRGLNIKHTRPDMIICDDMQTRENDESPTESLRLLRWFTATLLKLVAPRGDRLVIYIGNMYSEDCILRKLQSNTKWTSLVTGAILDNGEPLWPELHSLEDLMESYIHDEELGQADTWFAEVMNDPKNPGKALLPIALPDSPFSEEEVPDGVFLSIDPAGFRDISDDNVIVVHHVIGGKGVAKLAVMGIMDPKELIKNALELALSHGASLIAVESVAYQQTLGFWLKFFMAQLQITGIEVVEVHPHGRHKEARIRQFIAELYAQEYYLGPDLRPHYVWQANKYKIGAKKNKDDLLDAVAYGIDVRNEYWHLIKNLLTEGRFAIQASVVGNNTPF